MNKLMEERGVGREKTDSCMHERMDMEHIPLFLGQIIFGNFRALSGISSNSDLE
jgi:hypothetical protein